MALRIKRQDDSRQVKPILHRVADIPGGVAIDSSLLGGSYLYEGTPIAVGSDGKHNVVKTAKIVTEAGATDTNYEVAKGHHFKVGDIFTVGAKAYTITAIDKTTNSDKDVITLNTTLGVVVSVGSIAFEATAESAGTAVAKATPVAIIGSNYDVVSGENLFSEAFVIAVVKDGVSVSPITATQKTALKSIVFI